MEQSDNGVSLHYRQNGNNRCFTDLTDVKASNLKHYKKNPSSLLRLQPSKSNKRDQTMQLALLYKTPPARHCQAISNAVVASDDVTLPHSRRIMLQPPRCVVQAVIIMETAQ